MMEKKACLRDTFGSSINYLHKGDSFLNSTLQINLVLNYMEAKEHITIPQFFFIGNSTCFFKNKI